MSELHRQSDDSQLAMVHGPDQPLEPSPSEILQPDAIKRQIVRGFLQRAVPTLYEIRRARDDQRLTQSQADDYLAKLQTIVRHELDTNILERYPEPKELERLFGQNYLGPEAARTVWGVEVGPTILPPIPFDTDDLTRSAKRGELLGLTLDRAPDGSPLTMERMGQILAPRWAKAAKGALFPASPWYQEEDFYRKETPQLRWVLMSPDILPGSTNSDYLEQTDLLITHHRTTTYPAGLPPLYEKAVAEYKAKKLEIEPILQSDWQTAAQLLEDLPLAQLLRPTPAELAYILVTDHTLHDRRLLPSQYAWTGRRYSFGRLVSVGEFDGRGLGVDGWEPWSRSDFLGGVAFRSQ